MKECHAKSTDVLCLVDLNLDNELVPEPFRMQESLCVKVTTDAYTDFILRLPDTLGSMLLPINVAEVKRYACLHSQLLYNSFLSCMAFAIVKELHFAEKYKRVCTTILPASLTAPNANVRAIIDTLGSYLDRHVSSILDLSRRAGLVVPESPCFEHNVLMLRFAAYLYNISRNKGIPENNFTLK